MAAAIKALNSRIRSNKYLDYFCSTHFWGPASNFGIPIAAVMDTQKDPSIVSGRMTAALMGYSGIFMRYSMMVTPKNYLLFGCHIVNFSAQSVQMYRFMNYWYMGGRDQAIDASTAKGAAKEAEGAAKDAKGKAEGLAADAKAKAEELSGKATNKVKELTGKN